jgi:hypothetical protein
VKASAGPGFASLATFLRIVGPDGLAVDASVQRVTLDAAFRFGGQLRKELSAPADQG